MAMTLLLRQHRECNQECGIEDDAGDVEPCRYTRLGPETIRIHPVLQRALDAAVAEAGNAATEAAVCVWAALVSALKRSSEEDELGLDVGVGDWK